MLNLLEITALEAIDSNCRQDAYINGKQPLLKYSPEALVKYACAIHAYILPHFDGATGITDDEYISKWTAPHTKAMTLLASKDYLAILADIVATPEPAPEGYSLEKDVYAEISAYIDNHKHGADWYFFEGINDFLTNSHSPLRWDTVTDSRIIKLVAEVDAIRNACNKELEAFIGKQPTIDDEAIALSYSRPAPKPKYGTELEHYRELIAERLAYYKLKPKTIALLTASKNQIPPLDWDEISKALEAKIISENTRKLITATLSALRQATKTKAKKAKSPANTIAPSVAVDANTEFIKNFIQKLASAYAMPAPVAPVAPPESTEPPTDDVLDDIYSTLDAFYTAHAQCTSLEAVEAQQKDTELWYSDFNNIAQQLTACLEIALNKLSPEAVLSEEELSHGAIRAMLAFAKSIRSKVLYKLNANILDYTALEQELRRQIQVQTAYYTDIEPLPNIEPLNKVQLIDTVCKATAPLLPSLFDLTPPIQEVLDSIKANAVTTNAVTILSEAEVQSIVTMLVPITDFTIKEMANMLTGQLSTPYLADGALVIHAAETDQYLRVVPTIIETKYAEYQFKTYNWDTLTGKIYSLQKLLAKRPIYSEWLNGEPEYTYKFLPKNVELRKTAIKEATELYERLLSLANMAFDDEDEIALRAIREITSTYYYRDFIRISGHRLSAWVYYPEEYRLISTPPIDASGYKIDYEPNHINGIRSDNRPSNLKIETKKLNLDLRSTSRPVTYSGQPYLTLRKYCDAYGLSYTYLQNYLANLLPGEVREHNSGSINRAYSLGADGWTYVVTDVAPKASVYSYGGTDYPDLKSFAKSLALTYGTLHKGLSRAKEAKKSEYKFKNKGKMYTFYLDTNGNITKIL